MRLQKAQTPMYSTHNLKLPGRSVLYVRFAASRTLSDGLQFGSSDSGREIGMQKTSGARFVRLFLLAGVMAAQLSAQGDRGVITGTVTDASGAIVPGAAITIIQNGTNTLF